MKQNNEKMEQFNEAAVQLDKIVGKITDREYISEIKKAITNEELEDIVEEVKYLVECMDDVAMDWLDAGVFIKDVTRLSNSIEEIEKLALMKKSSKVCNNQTEVEKG